MKQPIKIAAIHFFFNSTVLTMLGAYGFLRADYAHTSKKMLVGGLISYIVFLILAAISKRREKDQ